MRLIIFSITLITTVIRVIPVQSSEMYVRNSLDDIRIKIDKLEKETTDLKIVYENILKDVNKLKKYNKNLSNELAIQYIGYINRYSKIYNIDRYVLMSIMIVESTCKANSVSHKNAIGLMQVRPSIWCKELKISKNELYNPETNIMAGSHVLRYYLDRYNNDLLKAITAYNTGSYKGYTKYTKKVLTTYFKIKQSP